MLFFDGPAKKILWYCLGADQRVGERTTYQHQHTAAAIALTKSVNDENMKQRCYNGDQLIVYNRQVRAYACYLYCMCRLLDAA